jgi:hypothetical protein
VAGNQHSNIIVMKGGVVLAGDGCRAADSKEGSGVEVKETGSKVWAGSACVAEGNKMSGFAARFGGQLVLGAKCMARGNGMQGYYADGVVTRGVGCTYECNTQGGEGAVRGGKIVTWGLDDGG